MWNTIFISGFVLFVLGMILMIALQEWNYSRIRPEEKKKVQALKSGFRSLTLIHWMLAGLAIVVFMLLIPTITGSKKLGLALCIWSGGVFCFLDIYRTHKDIAQIVDSRKFIATDKLVSFLTADLFIIFGIFTLFS